MPHFIKRFRNWGFIALLFLLQACSQLSTQPDTRSLDAIQYWEIRGKVSLSAQGERNTANFRWQQHNDDYEILLHGPFGSGAVKLNREHGLVTFNDGEQKRQAMSAENLLYDSTGWILPVNALRWWVKGLPDPGIKIESQSVTETGELKNLKQNGWTLSYKNYLKVRGHHLPTKIVARKDEVKLVMAIKSWKI